MLCMWSLYTLLLLSLWYSRLCTLGIFDNMEQVERPNPSWECEVILGQLVGQSMVVCNQEGSNLAWE